MQNTSVFSPHPSCKTHPCSYECVCNAANTFVCSRMQLQLCKTHPCSYGCVCNAANPSVLLRIGLQHRKPIHSHTNGNSTLITHPDTTNVIIPLTTHPWFYGCVISISKLIRVPTDEFVALRKSFVALRIGLLKSKTHPCCYGCVFAMLQTHPWRYG